MDQFNDHLLVFLNEYGATVMGFVLAFLMALWRTAKVNGKADWLEASMCAGFTLGVASFLAYLGLPQTLSIGIGAFFGYMGTHKISRFISKKINFEDDDK